MQISLAEAAKLAGITKSALFKAVKRGAVSGLRDELTGEWRIDVSELERVYPLSSPSAQTTVSGESIHTQPQNSSAVFSAERQHFESRIASLESERDWLRQSLQTETEERRQLTRMLTHLQQSAEPSAPVQRIPWILYVIGLSTLIGAVVTVWRLVVAG